MLERGWLYTCTAQAQPQETDTPCGEVACHNAGRKGYGVICYLPCPPLLLKLLLLLLLLLLLDTELSTALQYDKNKGCPSTSGKKIQPADSRRSPHAPLVVVRTSHPPPLTGCTSTYQGRRSKRDDGLESPELKMRILFIRVAFYNVHRQPQPLTSLNPSGRCRNGCAALYTASFIENLNSTSSWSLIPSTPPRLSHSLGVSTRRRRSERLCTAGSSISTPGAANVDTTA